MKSLIFKSIFFTMLAYPTISLGAKHESDVIADPTISSRCLNTNKDRMSNIEIKQRLKQLIERNSKLQENTPENKKTLLKKLEVNMMSLKNELKIINVRIEKLEEEIVKKGCPGIAL